MPRSTSLFLLVLVAFLSLGIPDAWAGGTPNAGPGYTDKDAKLPEYQAKAEDTRRLFRMTYPDSGLELLDLKWIAVQPVTGRNFYLIFQAKWQEDPLEAHVWMYETPEGEQRILRYAHKLMDTGQLYTVPGPSYQGLDAWMSNMNRDYALTSLVIPGSHDTGTYPFTNTSALSKYSALLDCPQTRYLDYLMREPRPADAALRGMFQRWSKAQRLDVTAQLQQGVRYFDFRTEWKHDGAVPPENGHYYLVHGMYGADLFQVLDQIAAFLREQNHRKEIVILDFQSFQDLGPDQHKEVMKKIEDTFSAMLIPKGEGKDRENPDKLKLGDLWAKGRQVLVFYDCPKAPANTQGPPTTEEEKRKLVWWSQVTNSTSLWNRERVRSEWCETSDPDDLRECLSKELTQRKGGQIHVLQTILTPDPRVIAEGEARPAKLEKAAAAASTALRTARGVVDAAARALEGAERGFESLMSSLHVTSLIKLAGRTLAKACGKADEYDELQRKIDEARAQRRRADQLLAQAERAASEERARLEKAPRSLLEMADRVAPRVFDWADQWHRKAAMNVVILDAVEASKVRPLVEFNHFGGLRPQPDFLPPFGDPLSIQEYCGTRRAYPTLPANEGAYLARFSQCGLSWAQVRKWRLVGHKGIGHDFVVFDLTPGNGGICQGDYVAILAPNNRWLSARDSGILDLQVASKAQDWEKFKVFFDKNQPASWQAGSRFFLSNRTHERQIKCNYDSDRIITASSKNLGDWERTTVTRLDRLGKGPWTDPRVWEYIEKNHLRHPKH